LDTIRHAAAMIPRSQAGRAIVAGASGASRTAVHAAPDRVTRLEKPNRDVKLGLRFGLHPQSKQVVVSELYSGYPAQQSGKIFMGDVVTMINGVRITDVEMAAQIIKLTAGTVEIRTTNVFVEKRDEPSKPAAATGLPSAGLAARERDLGTPGTAQSAAAPPPPPPLPLPDLMGGMGAEPPAAAAAAEPPDLLGGMGGGADDLLGGDPLDGPNLMGGGFEAAFPPATAAVPAATPLGMAPAGFGAPPAGMGMPPAGMVGAPPANMVGAPRPAMAGGMMPGMPGGMAQPGGGMPGGMRPGMAPMGGGMGMGMGMGMPPQQPMGAGGVGMPPQGMGGGMGGMGGMGMPPQGMGGMGASSQRSSGGGGEAPPTAAVGDLVLDDPDFFVALQAATPAGYNPLAAPLSPDGLLGGGAQAQIQQQVLGMYAEAASPGGAGGAAKPAAAPAPAAPANPNDPWAKGASLIDF